MWEAAVTQFLTKIGRRSFPRDFANYNQVCVQLWQLEVNEKGGIDIVPAFFKKEEDEEQEQKKGDSVQSYYTPQMGPAPNTYAFCSMQRDLRGVTLAD